MLRSLLEAHTAIEKDGSLKMMKAMDFLKIWSLLAIF